MLSPNGSDAVKLATNQRNNDFVLIAGLPNESTAVPLRYYASVSRNGPFVIKVGQAVWS